MVKIGIISDVHSNFEALRSSLNYLKKARVLKILCAGDIIGYYTRPKEVVQLIKERKVICIKGNHEIGLLFKKLSKGFNMYALQGLAYSDRNLSSKDKHFLKKLPITYRNTFGGKKVIMIHGSPANPLEEYVYQEDIDSAYLHVFFKTLPDVLILGNTHIPFIKDVESTLVINPGSIGQPRDGDPRSSFAIYDSIKNTARIVRLDYNIGKTAEEARNLLSTKLADRLYKGL